MLQKKLSKVGRQKAMDADIPVDEVDSSVALVAVWLVLEIDGTSDCCI